MKSKVYLVGISQKECPFMDAIDTVICENWVECDPGWLSKATHICSCEYTRILRLGLGLKK